MKLKVLIVIAVTMFFMSGVAIADPPDFIPPGHQYGGQGGDANVDVKSINTNINTNSAKADATANATAVQGQMQGQIAVGSVETSVNVKGTSFSYTEAEEKLQPTNVPAYNAPIMQGKDGIYKILPIEGIIEFNPSTDKIKTIIDTINGFPGWRTRLENLYPTLLNNKVEGDNIRYIIFYKDASTGGSVGTGAGGSASFGNSFDFGATATGGTGYSQATFNREFYILIVTIN